jgi:flavin-dependent dehydrogenase
VREIARGAHGWRLATADGRAVRASWLIGADGANSFVRRSVARGFPRDQISIATGYFAYGVASREVVIELVDEPPGYIWSFPRPDHLAIGICAQADAGIGADALRGRVAAWIDRTGIADGARLVPYSWPIPSFTTRGFDRTPCSGERWMTIGDAAGLVDPITREGIFFALQSAGLAADAIAHAPRDAADHFARAVRETIVADLRQAAALKQGFFRPRFTRLLVDALQRSAAIRGVMVDLIAGTQPYRELKWRLMKTFEWKLAWRLVTARDSRRAPAPAAPAASR